MKRKQLASLTLSDLEQVKVLADPLRVRILEELAVTELTTKQVAARLKEKQTKLYHHVEALERVGLIRLTRTKQNRGTLEKYYLAVARQFRADSRMFDSKPKKGSLQHLISTAFERTTSELLARTQGDPKGVAEQGVLSFLEIRTTAADARRLQARIQKLIASLQDDKPTRRGDRRYRLTLAFYPLA